MVWITKRELTYYFVLKHVFRDRVFNIGEAFDILILFGTKRTAKKIVKKLTSLGFLEKISDANYRVRELEQALFNNLKRYAVQRISRRMKLLGLNVDIVLDEGGEKITLQNCDEKLQTIISILGDVLNIECIKVV